MIRTNSKEVKKNDIFISDDDKYIKEALNRGAKLIITEKKVKIDDEKIKKVDDIFKTKYDMFAKLYHIDKDLKLIGITGTDGKTTTATIISELLDNASYLGTNGFKIGRYHKDTRNTTPKIEDILYYQKKTIKHKGKTMVMEVSSEGLYYNRLEGLQFDIAILTNITKDHLNTHKNIFNYIKTKAKLFEKIKENGVAIINRDDKYYHFINKKCNCNTITYGINSKSNAIIKDIKENSCYTSFNLAYKGITYNITSPFIGIFNVYNLTAAIIALNCLGMDMNEIIKRIYKLKPVSGRLERLNYSDYQIYLDYAHTINATKSVLNLLKRNTKGRLITVVGCAGGRDKTKRSKIGKIVTKLSDITIFTMDDPRYEDVNKIIDDMAKRVRKRYIREIDRKKAIYLALSMAKKGDTVAILGKGNDNYMAIEDKYLKYNDKDIIKSFFK
jgi:UDP-N-acetylmuramoyl-L-alanyl-D-glutamate--2,6-diaminopimelate ligase